MKQPRIKDFDPNALPKLGSPMDSLPPIEKPSTSQVAQTPPATGGGSAQPSPAHLRRDAADSSWDEAVGPTPVPADERPYGRSTPPRTVRRYAFEFYQDQLATLRHLSLEEKLRGEKGSMSEMVREAIDAYITKRQKRQS